MRKHLSAMVAVRLTSRELAKLRSTVRKNGHGARA